MYVIKQIIAEKKLGIFLYATKVIFLKLVSEFRVK